jgi:hypothetical protein
MTCHPHDPISHILKKLQVSKSQRFCHVYRRMDSGHPAQLERDFDRYLDSVMRNIAYLRALTVTAKARVQVLGLDLDAKEVEVPELEPPRARDLGAIPAVEDYSRTMKQRLEFYVEFLHQNAQWQKYKSRFGDYTNLLNKATSDLTEFLVTRAPPVNLSRLPEDIWRDFRNTLGGA